MTQDFRPEDVALVQRALLGIDLSLLFLAGAIVLWSRPALTAAREVVRVRVPRPVQAAALALVTLLASTLVYRELAADQFPERLAESLTGDFAKPLLLSVCAALLSLGLGLKVAADRAPVALRLAAEALLVPGAFLIGLALIYLTLPLTDLELWAGFKQAAFYSAAIFAIPIAVIPGAFRARGFAVVMGLLLAVVFGDLIYLRYFGNIVPVLGLGAGGQLWDVRDIIIKYTRAGDAWLLLVMISSSVLAFLWPKRTKGDALPAVRGAIDVLLLGTCLAVTLPLAGLVQRWMDSDRSWRVLNGTDAVQDSGVVVAHIKEIARSIRDARMHGTLTEDEFAKVRRYHAERGRTSPRDADFALARGSNLILIQVEAMQEWVIGAHYEGQELTPFLNGLQRRAWYFDRLYDETGDSSTSDCEYMVLNSQYPIPQGSVAFRRDENQFVTLLHAFKDAGYTTFAGHAYAAGMWNRAVLYPKYGFDQTAFKDELGDGPKLGWGIGDKPFFERVVPKLERLRRPFVSLLITLTSHGPYQYVPKAERKLRLGSIEGSDFGGYLHSMRYNDEALAQLFQQLERARLLQNTTLVIYGDHDSRMKFPAQLAAGTDLSPDVQQRLAARDYTTKQIPLFIVLPESAHANARRVHTIGGQVNIGATLVHLFGLERPGSFIGESLLPEHVGHAARIDGSGVDGERIFIAPGGGRCESFPDFQPLRREACAALSERTREELNMSWDVTLLDLAARLAGKTPQKAAAQR